VTLDEISDRLYALAPEEFTAARDAAAKQAKANGDTELATQVKALRKPSVGAWLVNLLATGEADLLEQLLSLGPALAEAQARGHGDELRQLSAQRRELVGAVTSRAVELSGRSTTAAVRDEVSSTLEAALADAPSADAVRSGTLVRALSYAGFGGVDLEGAVGGPVRRSGPEPRKKAPDDGVAQAEAAALEAAGRLDDVVRACERAERERAAADEQAERAHAEVARLQQALADAEAAAHDADQQRKAAHKQSEKAVDAVRKAQRAEEQARAELDRLRRS
jgi:hypothetical protein